MTVDALRHAMTERELRRWMLYASQRRLPTRRIEFYFAQVAYLIAKTMGASTANSFTDFLIDFEPPKLEEIPATVGAHVLGGVSGKGVRILGQRRREREAEHMRIH